MSTNYASILSSYLLQLPSLLVALLGIILTVVKWQRAPSASAWALFGFLLVMLFGLGGRGRREGGGGKVGRDGLRLIGEQGIEFFRADVGIGGSGRRGRVGGFG